MTLRTTVVDGVTVHWLDHANRSTLNASLIFRAGMFDESLPLSGVTHLLEHLTLHDAHLGGLDYNGSVTGLLTSFDCHGRPDEVAGFLHNVCNTLHARPDPELLAHEQGVLAAERAIRASTVLSRALAFRYGAHGPGVMDWSDLGLERLGTHHVAQLSAAAFTSGNAVLALDGPLPANLRLGLPSGPRRPTGRTHPLPLGHPIVRESFVDTVTVSGTVGRRPEMTLAAGLWAHRVQRQLRPILGPRGRAAPAYEFTGSNEVEMALVVPVTAPRAARVLHVMRRELIDLAVTGPTARELADQLEWVQLRLRLPETTRSATWSLARSELTGAPQSPEEQRDALAMVTPAHIAGLLSELRGSEMIQVPPGTDLSAEPDCRYPPAPATEPPIGASVHGLAGPAGLFQRQGPRFWLADDTLGYCSPDHSLTISLPDVSGLVVWPDGAVVVIGRDGTEVRVETLVWRRGDDLTAAIREAVPVERWIDRPPRRWEHITKPRPFAELYREAVVRWARRDRQGTPPR